MLTYIVSEADFISKLQIALKECYETEYWIELFVKADILDREFAKDLYNQRVLKVPVLLNKKVLMVLFFYLKYLKNYIERINRKTESYTRRL